ncbi:hypothetical protein [Streptomyces mayteni]
MRGDEELEAVLRGSDPARDAALPDPAGPDGLRILTGARRRAGRSRLRRLLVIPTAVAVTVGAATAAVVLATGEGAVVDSTLVRCMAPEGLSYSPYPAYGRYDYTTTDFNPVTDDYSLICASGLYEEDGGEPALVDVQLTACVNDEGQIVVRPGGTGVCAENDEVLYVGVTQEQRQLAEFRVALEETTRLGQCTPMTELPALADRLQAEHDLSGWTVRLSDDVPGECVSNLLFRESEREITAWAREERPIGEVVD